MKKLTLLIPLFAVLFLVWCGTKKDVVQQPTKTIEKQQATEPKVEEPKEIIEDVLDSDQDNHPHDWTEEEGHDDTDTIDDHGDTKELFDTLTFSSNTTQSIDGYDIEIKHKDTHAWDKFTWTVSITQWWEKIDGLELIDGDQWVWITKDPVEHTEHLHPVANTKNTLTFSSHTHDEWTYQVITQFKHDGKTITIPYQVDILVGDDDHGH